MLGSANRLNVLSPYFRIKRSLLPIFAESFSKAQLVSRSLPQNWHSLFDAYILLCPNYADRFLNALIHLETGIKCRTC